MSLRITKLPKSLSALRHRNYSLFFFGQLISLTGTWMQSLAMGWLVLKLTNSPFYLGLVGALNTLPTLLVSLPSGVIADRFEKRKIVIVTQSLAMVQAFTLTALVYFGHIQTWHVIILSAFMGFVMAMDAPVRQSMTVELASKEDLLNAVALNSAVFNGARIIGPALGGLVLAEWGMSACFLINAISFIAALVSLVLMRTTFVPKASREESMAKQTREGFAYVWHHPLMRDLLILTGVSSIFALPYTNFLPALARDVLHTNEKGLGLISACTGVGAFAGAVFLANLGGAFQRQKVAVIGALLASSALTMVVFVASLFTACIALILIGFGMMLFLATSNGIMQADAPDHLRGRVMAIRILVFFGFAPLGSLLIGKLAQDFGVTESIFIGGVCMLAVTLAYSIKMLSGKSTEA